MSHEVTRQDRAKMAMYRAMNFDLEEIAAETGWGPSTVSDHLSEMEAEAKASDDPEAYFWSVVMSDVFDESFMMDWGRLLAGK